MAIHDGNAPTLGLVSSLARTLASTQQPDAVYRVIAEAATTSFGATAARVWIADSETSVLRAAGSHGVNAEVERSLLDFTSVPFGTGIPGHIVLSRAAEFLTDSSTDSRWVNTRFIRVIGVRAYAGLPLIAADVIVGVLSIMFDTVREFSEPDRTLAGVFADYSAIAIRMAQLYEERRRADALAAVNQLAAATAHELNNPLAVILGNLSLLEKSVGDRPDARARIGRVMTASARMTDIIKRMNQLVDLEMHASSSPGRPMLDIRRSSQPGSGRP